MCGADLTRVAIRKRVNPSVSAALNSIVVVCSVIARSNEITSNRIPYQASTKPTQSHKYAGQRSENKL